MSLLAPIDANVRKLLAQLTAQGADQQEALTTLLTAVVTCAQAGTALSNTVWTDARAGNLDRVDAAVSSRASEVAAAARQTAVLAALPKSKMVFITTSQNWVVPAGVTGGWLTGIGGGGGGAYYSSSYGRGGAGAVIFRMPVRLTPGESVPCIIGAAGTDRECVGPTNSVNGTAGGNTTFGGIVMRGGNVGYCSLSNWSVSVSNAIAAIWVPSGPFLINGDTNTGYGHYSALSAYGNYGMGAVSRAQPAMPGMLFIEYVGGE